MSETFAIPCPCCGVILIVDRRTGAILEQRTPPKAGGTGNKLTDALIAEKSRGDVLSQKVAAAQAKEKTRSERLGSLFSDAVDRAKADDKDKKPLRPMDLD